jgi:hypothetical protein
MKTCIRSVTYCSMWRKWTWAIRQSDLRYKLDQKSISIWVPGRRRKQRKFPWWMKICDSLVSYRSLLQRRPSATLFPICTALYNSKWTTWVIGIDRKLDVRKWCSCMILGWWQRSNSWNVGPVCEYIFISSDPTNNSSDSFITIDFCCWKDMRRARNAFR